MLQMIRCIARNGQVSPQDIVLQVWTVARILVEILLITVPEEPHRTNPCFCP
jgi:hypothetical protein